MKAKRIEEMMREQAAFEEQLTSTDKNLYEAIFKNLDEEPNIHIPVDFADKIAAKVTGKAMLWSDVKLYALYSGLFLFLVGTCIAFFGFDTSTSGEQTQKFLLTNLPLIVLGTLLYFAIQTLDRVLVKGR